MAAGTGGRWVYAGLFLVVAGETSAFLGLLMPGEAAVLAAGALAAQGRFSLPAVVAVVVAGALVGDTIGYALGRRIGQCRENGFLARIWSCARTWRVRRFLRRHRRSAVFLGRFVGFLRPLVPFAAGAVRMPFRAFLLYNLAGALVWGVGMLLAGYALGARARQLVGSVGAAGALAAAVVAMAVVAAGRHLRGRRPADPADPGGTYPARRSPPSPALPGEGQRRRGLRRRGRDPRRPVPVAVAPPPAP